MVLVIIYPRRTTLPLLLTGMLWIGLFTMLCYMCNEIRDANIEFEVGERKDNGMI